MTIEQSNNAETEGDARELAARARAWWDGLTPEEQARLGRLSEAAGAADDDVQGFGELEYAAVQLFFQGDPLPALRLAMNAYYAQPAPLPPVGPGASSGGTWAPSPD